MRSARRRALMEKKKKTGKITGLFFKFFLPVILIICLFVIFKLDTRYWNGHDKFILAYRLGSGDAAISVLDPRLDEITTLDIPADTEVNVARNYGELRIKNVWQLGMNEKIRGKLLAETITQNFLFPVFLWSDSDAKSLADGNLAGILRFIFFPKSTNISLADRISAGLFALRVGDLGKNWLDLGKNQFLAKQKLNDGQPGYILAGTISPRLTAYFADNTFADKNLRVAIGDATGVPGVADAVGQIIEVVGAKIVSIDKKNEESSDCTVFGSDVKAVKKIADIFSCKVRADRGGMDLEIDLGSVFAKRF
ncbi:MAG: hypothetical protein NTZ07_02880 [Candidatus Woesebacteria bacterium]|nr:hypothetical protein [Candidatus Woesebacteria bacterium]